MQGIETIAQVLRDWGIHAGSWSRRHDLSRVIAQTGVEFTDDTARALHTEAKDVRCARNPLGLMLTWLADGSWVELMQDLEHARQHATANAVRTQDRNACDWKPDERWEAERLQAEVLARALGDRRDAEFVAQQTALTVEQVRDIVAQHGARTYSQQQVDWWLDPKAAARARAKAMRALKKTNKTASQDPINLLD